MSKLRRKFSKEEKLEIVKQSLEPKQSIKELSDRYNICPNSIYNWRKEYIAYEGNAFPGNGNILGTDQEKEIRKLQKQVRELELEKEILKKAMGIFSSPNKISLLS